MPHPWKTSANIASLFGELEMMDRVAAAADAGFDGVELPLPFDHPAPVLRDKAVFSGIPFVRMDAPPPNYTGGPQGFAGSAALEDRFRTDFNRALRQAQVLRASRVHIRVANSADPDILEEQLRWAVTQAPKIILLLKLREAAADPDHLLADIRRAVDLLDRVAAETCKLMIGARRASEVAGGAPEALRICQKHLGHVLLDVEDPLSRPQGVSAFLDDLSKQDFKGWLCADYSVAGPTHKTLDWLTP